ncbi:MAG: high frequency lysogenization protein HflD [Pseudomonadota bacterium]
MSHSIEDQTLALAGIVQACLLVRELAHQGQAPEHAFQASIASIFRLDAPDVPAVYDGVLRIGDGLRHLRKQLSGQAGQQDAEIMRHSLTLLHLAQQLMQNQTMWQTLGAEIQAIGLREKEQDWLHPSRIEDLAALYQKTISTLTPKIMVKGNPNQLNQPWVAQRIRAALLAGIRSAVLWHQCGGSKWNLLFRRKRFIEATDHLLRNGLRAV